MQVNLLLGPVQFSRLGIALVQWIGTLLYGDKIIPGYAGSN